MYVKQDSFHHIIFQKEGSVFESLKSLQIIEHSQLLWIMKYYLGKTNISLRCVFITSKKKHNLIPNRDDNTVII